MIRLRVSSARSWNASGFLMTLNAFIGRLRNNVCLCSIINVSITETKALLTTIEISQTCIGTRETDGLRSQLMKRTMPSRRTRRSGTLGPCANVAIPPVGQLPEPLRLPHGSVRGAIAIVVTAAYGYVLLQGGSAPTVLVNAVVVVIAFYFGSRAASTPPSLPSGQPPPHHPMLVRILIFLGFTGL